MTRSVMAWNDATRTILSAAFAAALAGVAFAHGADDQYSVAAGHYARQQWPFAAEEFEAFLRDHPSHPRSDQGVFFLGETLVQLRRYDKACQRFREYLDRAPNGRFSRAALFRAGESAYLAGKLEEAKSQLDTFLSEYPDDRLNAYVLTYLGDLALSEGAAATAEAYYRRGLADFPQSRLQDDCRFGLAQALQKQNREEEAERLYLALAAKPRASLAGDAQFCMGSLQYASGRLDEAIAAFEAFESDLATSPRRPTARLARGWALWKLDRLDEAAEVFRLITSDPEVGTEARYWLGLTEKSREDWTAAAAMFLDAVEADPQHELVPALRFHAGDAMLRAGDAPLAREQFDLVIESAPAGNEWLDDALKTAAQAALLEKDHAGVERYAATFSRRCPDSPLRADVRRLLARSLIEREDYAEAKTVVAPLLDGEAGGSPSAEDHYLHALVCRELGCHEDALAALSAAAGSAEGRLAADAQLARASLLSDLNRYEAAIDPLQAYLASCPTEDAAAEARAQLAVCFARSGQLEEAKRAQQELLGKHGGHQVIAPALAQLAEAAGEAGDEAWASELFTWLSTSALGKEDQQKGLAGVAWIQYKTGRLEEAATTFERLLKSGPRPTLAAEASLARGRILQELGRDDAALATYDVVIEQHPQSEQFVDALWAAARLRDQLNLDQEAAALYEKLAREVPEFPRIDVAVYNWAWTLSDLGRVEDSYRLFERLHQDHPKSDYWADATYRLAQRAFKTGRHGRARELVNAALDGKPGPALRENFLYLQGQILAADEMWHEAQASFETLVADYPQGTLRRMAEYGIAEAFFRQGDYPTAEKRLRGLRNKTLDEKEPWLAIVHLRLAQSLAHQQRWSEAATAASTIESRFPGFAKQYEVDYVLGRCFASRADFDRARKAYRDVIRSPEGAKTETAAKAQLMIAESHFHQKSCEVALREYLRLEILYDYPELQAAALLQAAKCHELLGEPQRAAELYKRLFGSFPETSAAEEAKRRQQTGAFVVPPSGGKPPTQQNQKDSP